MSELPSASNRIYVVPRDPTRLDATFLFYYLSWAFSSGVFQSIAAGAVQKSITAAKVRKLPLEGILASDVVIPADSSSRRRRRPKGKRPAQLGDIAKVSTSKPKDLAGATVLQRVCDPKGTNCGRPYIVVGTAPLFVRSAPTRNPSWRRKADTAMRQGRIAFERIKRGADVASEDVRRATAAAAEAAEQARRRFEERQREEAYERMFGSALRIVNDARLIGVDPAALAQEMASQQYEAWVASGYTLALSDIEAYMRMRVNQIAAEMFNQRWEIRPGPVPGTTFARGRYPGPEAAQASFRRSRGGQPSYQRAPFQADPEAQRRQRAAEYQAQQARAREAAESRRAASARSAQQQAAARLDAVLGRWGFPPGRSPTLSPGSVPT